MRVLCYLFLCLFFQTALAQEKITDFENITKQSPDNLIYRGTINDKVIFSTSIMPQEASQLWVSDGTPEGTKPLKSFNGPNGYFNGFHTLNNWLYFAFNNKLWKTDGNVVELAIEFAQKEIYSNWQFFNNQLLIIQQLSDISHYPMSGFNYYKFLIASQNTADTLNLTTSNQFVMSYRIVDKKLYYNTYSFKDSVWALHCYANQKTQIIHQEKTLYNATGVNHFYDNNALFLHISLSWLVLGQNNVENLRKVIRLDTTNKAEQISQWTGNVNQYYDANSKKNYLFRQFKDSLQLYQTNSIGQFNLLKQLYIDKFECSFQAYSNQYYGFQYTYNKLNFMASDGAFLDHYCFYLYEYDLATNQTRKSKNLIDIFKKDSPIKAEYIKENEYRITSGRKQIIYNLTTHTWTDELIANTIEIKDKKIQLTDTSLTLLKNSEKIDLLTQYKQFYFDKDRFYSSHITYGKQLILFVGSYDTETFQMWVSNGEKGGTKFITNIEGYPSEDISVINDKLIFYTKASNRLNIYQTDGTVGGTQNLFSSDMSIKTKVANHKQVVFYLNGKTSPTQYLVNIEADKVHIIDLSKTNVASIIQTDTHTYLYSYVTSPILIGGILYRLEQNTLKPIAKDVYHFTAYQDRLYLHSYDQFKIKLGYIDASDRISLISEGGLEAYKILNNQLIRVQYLTKDLTKTYLKYIITDLETDKETTSLEQEVSNNYDYKSLLVEASGTTIILTLEDKILLIDTKQKKEISINRQDRKIVLFANGLLLFDYRNGNTKLDYYDLSNYVVTNIPVNKISGEILFSTSEQFLLIPEGTNGRVWKLWNTTDKRGVSLSADIGEFYSVNGNVAFEKKDDKYYYWRYENNQLIRKYQFPHNSDNLIFEPISNQYFISHFTAEAGNELAQLGKDSINYLPEIVKGSEGIILSRLINFNNKLYAVAFTQTYGWQVWKMDEIESLILSAEPLANDAFPVIYPNPVLNLLTIASEKSFNYRLLTTLGQQIMEGSLLPEQTLNLEHLEAGLYIIQLFDSKTSYKKKLVVVK